MLTKEVGRQRKSTGVRRAEVIAAVVDLIGEVGPEGVTTTAIARRVGVSQTALFKHFATKDAIWVAATDAIGDRIGPRMTEIAQAPGTPLDKVRALVVAYVELAREMPAINVLISHRSLPDGSTGLRARVAERFERLRQLILGLMIDAKETGALRGDLDPMVATALCIAVVQTNLLPRWSEPSSADPHKAELMMVSLLGLLKA